MGTFIHMFRKADIPEEKQQELLEMQKELLWRGGMMYVSSVSMFDKTLPLLKPPTLEESRNGWSEDTSCYPVWYNYFEHSAWETWCLRKDGRVGGRKVGWLQFSKVAYASMMLQEMLSPTTCFALIDSGSGDPLGSIRWISHLFGKEMNAPYHTTWNAYAATYLYYDERNEWEKEYENHEKDSLDRLLRYDISGNNPDKDEIEPILFLEDCYDLKFDADVVLKKYENQEDKQNIVFAIREVQKIKAYLEKTFPEGNAVDEILQFYKSKSSDKIPSDIQETFVEALDQITMPSAVITVALVFHTMFWPMWWKNESQFDEELFKKQAGLYPYGKWRTVEDFLRVDEIDCMAFYSDKHPYEFNFARLEGWFKKLRKAYFGFLESDELLFPDEPATKILMDIFCNITENYSMAIPFEDTFYELVENFKDRKYQAMLRVLAWITENHKAGCKFEKNDYEFDEVRRYYSLLYNKGIRNRVFGSKQDFDEFIKEQKEHEIDWSSVAGPAEEEIESHKEWLKNFCDECKIDYDAKVDASVAGFVYGYKKDALSECCQAIHIVVTELASKTLDEIIDILSKDNSPEYGKAVRNYYLKYYT